MWSYRDQIVQEHDERKMFKKAYREVRRSTNSVMLRLEAWWRGSRI
jgi:hypothetical protein